VDKRRIFEENIDYKRFLTLLYLCNGTRNIRVSDMTEWNFERILIDSNLNRGERLVDLAAYCLMPNHIHFVVREVREKGTAIFMQKIFTGYTMYFNIKYQRTGALFSGTFKSKHISDDRYLKQVVPYVLLNPIELFEPRWKEGKGYTPVIQNRLLEYPFSSLNEFLGNNRLESKLLNVVLQDEFEFETSLSKLLQGAKDYYLERNSEV